MSDVIIGITGGIGAGKSAVSNYLKKIGEHVICADQVSRQVVKHGEKGSEAIRRAFGDAFFFEDHTLNRRKLAQHVFGSPGRLTQLNEILHPIITNYIFSEAEKIEGRVFVDAALLIQTGMHKKTDYVWLVIADRELRISRVMARDGLSKDEVEKRIESQMSDRDMRAFADEVIENNGSIRDLHKEIDALLQKPQYSR